MATIPDMHTSLDDAKFFHNKINRIVRGSQEEHDLEVIRRYFRAYLYCWKTVLHFVREAKALTTKKAWVSWCQRWEAKHLNPDETPVMEQLRVMRDYDTHSGTIRMKGEVAAGRFPIVVIQPIKPSQPSRELVTVTNQGIDIITRLIATHAAFK